MLNFHKNHRELVGTAWLVFVFLSIMVAIAPAYELQEVRPIPGMKELSAKERAGLNIYVAENCVACHTQQVRNIAMDEVWGERPSIPSDYYYTKSRLDFWRQSPSLLGSERTGPDLSNAGARQPGSEWHLLHLYNPRIVAPASVMPAYPWLFRQQVKGEPLGPEEQVVPVPAPHLPNAQTEIVATKAALQLVAYLQSLKQAPLPSAPAFIPSSRKLVEVDKQENALPDGAKLYSQTCAACHQADGKGISGAFPALAGSPIVNNADPELLVSIILKGYDARAEFGVMPGFGQKLSDADIAAIANHERSSWGNQAPAITAAQVQQIRAQLK